MDSSKSDTSKPPAIIYCRVATTSQAELTHFLAAQEDHCRRHADNYGYEVVGVFKDQASGTVADRPGLTAMLSYLHRTNASGLTLVLVEDASRLARSPQLWEEISNSIFDAGGVVEYLH